MKYTLYLYKSKVSKILNRNEKIFFQGLKKHLQGRNLNICPKVRLNDIISVDKSLDEKKAKYINNKTFPKHLDFVVSNDSGDIQYIIELNGQEHKTDKKIIESDAIKEDICKQLRIPLIRIPNAPVYDYSVVDILFEDYC